MCNSGTTVRWKQVRMRQSIAGISGQLSGYSSIYVFPGLDTARSPPEALPKLCRSYAVRRSPAPTVCIAGTDVCRRRRRQLSSWPSPSTHPAFDVDNLSPIGLPSRHHPGTLGALLSNLSAYQPPNSTSIARSQQVRPIADATRSCGS